MTVRVGVIGTGVMGAEHARLLGAEVSGAAVTAVADADAARAARVADACGARVLDAQALITDDAVDAVLVASSDATHEEYVLACLAAGRPVLCEKPLAPDVAGCERVVAADAGRGLVSVGFMRRFDPGLVAARRALADVGPALLLHCVHRNAAGGPTPPEGLVTGSAVHEFDQARWLLDDEIASVTVHVPRASGRAGTQDPLFLVLRTAGGVLVDVEVFVNAGYGYDVRCEVVGERGTLTVDAPPPVATRSGGAVARPVAHDWRDRFVDAYRAELQAWVDAVRTGTPHGLATAHDGLAAAVVADAAVRALRTGAPQDVVAP